MVNKMNGIPAQVLVGVIGSMAAAAMDGGRPGRPSRHSQPVDFLGAFNVAADKASTVNNARKAAHAEKPTAKGATEGAARENRSTPEPDIFGNLGSFLGGFEKNLQKGFDFVFDIDSPETPAKPSEGKPGANKSASKTTDDTPPIDIILNANSVDFVFGVPGVTADDVAVTLDNEDIVVSLFVGSLEPEVEKNYLMQQIWKGPYKGTLPVPTTLDQYKGREIDEENISASVKDGLLTVNVPFKAVKKISIKVA